MPSKKTCLPAPTDGEPKLSVSLLGLRVEGSGSAGVRFAFWITLAVCGVAAVNMLLRFVS